MRAFIVRPFGTREGIDFDKVESVLIQPALTHQNIDGGTTGLILEAGNIREDMFQQLLVADLVIAGEQTCLDLPALAVVDVDVRRTLAARTHHQRVAGRSDRVAELRDRLGKLRL